MPQIEICGDKRISQHLSAFRIANDSDRIQSAHTLAASWAILFTEGGESDFWLLATCGRNDVIHPQVINHLPVVIKRMCDRYDPEAHPGRNHVEQRVLDWHLRILFGNR